MWKVVSTNEGIMYELDVNFRLQLTKSDLVEIKDNEEMLKNIAYMESINLSRNVYETLCEQLQNFDELEDLEGN